MERESKLHLLHNHRLMCPGLFFSYYANFTSISYPLGISVDLEQAKKGTYTSKVELRKNIRRMKNGVGKSHFTGARVRISGSS
ncbi:hypothetical protein LguiB_020485 [Lonicera macranthoides]